MKRLDYLCQIATNLAFVLRNFLVYIYYHHESILGTFLNTQVPRFLIDLFIFAYSPNSMAMGQSISAVVDDLQQDPAKEKLANNVTNSLIELAVSRV